MEETKNEQGNEDFEKPFYRARRTLGHLWNVRRGLKDFDPNDCDGCKEINRFLTDPNYRGDEHYPVYVEPDPELGPGWSYGPDEMEVTARDAVSAGTRDCPVCDRVQPVVRETNGDVTCTVCTFIFAT